jgi:hypothetical protein
MVELRRSWLWASACAVLLTLSQVSLAGIEPLHVLINSDDGSVTIKNDSGTAIDVASYEIKEKTDAEVWDIAQKIDLGLSLDLDTASKLAEADITGSATLDDGSMTSLGTPFEHDQFPSLTADDFSFEYGEVQPTGQVLTRTGVVDMVPEPTTLALVGLGAVAMLRRRR